MIAADTSVLIDYFQGKNNPQTDKLDEVFIHHLLVLPPTVLVEIISDPLLPKKFIDKIEELPLLEITKNYWQRAGINRSKLISKKLKARLADTLIAQSCIDHQVPLITRDTDFRHFVKYCGLSLF
ncbi:MAG: PilT protein domain protein [Gammaproteobacteria bacterium]|jgi:predicted nucleic acid-binding protein|nr:PilT protein domain protein [Gammaproteobacteria bacterium]MCE3237461.1 PilT protein domain protein [Gammaproteobacteria bacterium]